MSSVDRLPDQLTTAQVADSLDTEGFRHNVLDAAIRPLRQGMRALGTARTVQFAPANEASENPYDDMIAFIDSIQPGEVVVISTGGSPRSAYWGELFSAAAMGRGAAGLVCDSYTRDRGNVLPLGFPVFCVGTRPIDYRARMRVVATQEPVSCGDVDIEPGDLVLADDDGIVAVPAQAKPAVLERAMKRLSTEQDVLSDLLTGTTLREVWDRYRVL